MSFDWNFVSAFKFNCWRRTWKFNKHSSIRYIVWMIATHRIDDSWYKNEHEDFKFWELKTCEWKWTNSFKFWLFFMLFEFLMLSVFEQSYEHDYSCVLTFIITTVTWRILQKIDSWTDGSWFWMKCKCFFLF